MNKKSIYFKSKYIYIIFIIRILFLIFLITCLVFICTKEISNLNIVMVSIILGFFIYYFCRIVYKQRFQLIYSETGLAFFDFIFRKEINAVENVKGFSLSMYGNRGIYRYTKTIIFYCSSGDKIEFPQFLYWNFKEIVHFLEQEKLIPFLGEEPYHWKNLFSRKYHYD